MVRGVERLGGNLRDVDGRNRIAVIHIGDCNDHSPILLLEDNVACLFDKVQAFISIAVRAVCAPEKGDRFFNVDSAMLYRRGRIRTVSIDGLVRVR